MVFLRLAYESLDRRDGRAFFSCASPCAWFFEAVQGIEGDHVVGHAEWFQQRVGRGRLVVLGPHLPLGQGHGGSGEGKQQGPVVLM
jgi:hypothetical protein